MSNISTYPGYSRKNTDKNFKRYITRNYNTLSEKPLLNFISFSNNEKLTQIFTTDDLKTPSKERKVFLEDTTLITKDLECDNKLIKINLCETFLSSEFGRLNYTDDLYVTNSDNTNSNTEKSYLKRELCRLCAKLVPVANLFLIFNASSKYGDMLEMCLPGKIKENDKFPQNICYLCINKLEYCYKLLTSFLEADSNLKKIFTKSETVTENNLNVQFLNETENNSFNNQNLIPYENFLKIIESKFQCKICPTLYKNENELKDHIICKHSNKSKNGKFDFKIAKVKLLKRDKICVDSTIKNKDISEKTFEGMKCSKLLKNKEKVFEHSSTEHPQEKKCLYKIKVYECLLCNSHHRNKDALIKHFKLTHPFNKEKMLCRVLKSKKSRYSTLLCTCCNKIFTNISNYRKHTKSHIVYSCYKCGQNFDKLYKLKNHNGIHRKLKTYECIGCDQEFNSIIELNNHEQIHKELKEEVSCSKCNKQFSSAFSLRKHKQIHESALCEICGKLFPLGQYLQRHLETHSEDRPYLCKICRKTFKTMSGLSKHKSCHSIDKNYICQTCGKQFRTSGNLQQHMIIHNTVKKYVCDICGLRFHRRGNLLKHEQRHTNLNKEIFVYCEICRNGFSSKCAYNCHVHQRHGEKRSYLCSICNKKYRNKHQLNVHFRLHSGERPFECDFCEKSFRSKSGLNQHRLIHQDVFPHECDFCDRKFRRLQSLIVHRKTHTGERPFPCPFCGKAFANKGDMNKHKKIHIRNSIPIEKVPISDDQL